MFFILFYGGGSQTGPGCEPPEMCFWDYKTRDLKENMRDNEGHPLGVAAAAKVVVVVVLLLLLLVLVRGHV